MFSVTFDPHSLSQIAQLTGFEVYLSEEVQHALDQVSQMMAARAQAKTWQVFAHPTGALASTITPDRTSPFEAQVEVTSPYGRRREYGFSGHTDSLGRYYPHDPAKPYLAPTLQENQVEALGIVTEAVNRALGRVVV